MKFGFVLLIISKDAPTAFIILAVMRHRLMAVRVAMTLIIQRMVALKIRIKRARRATGQTTKTQMVRAQRITARRRMRMRTVRARAITVG
jgi:hypothetical protein